MQERLGKEEREEREEGEEREDTSKEKHLSF